jgi:hypothetical protein
MNKRRVSLLLTAALIAGGAGATIAAGAPAFASGAMVTQVSTVTVNAADPTVIDVGTINSQFTSITVHATGTTLWCNDNPNPPCVSDPTGSLYYSFPLGPNATAPGFLTGALVGKIGQNGNWFLVGNSYTATSPVVEHLYLAYDDDVFSDNTGSYSVTVTRVKPAS